MQSQNDNKMQMPDKNKKCSSTLEFLSTYIVIPTLLN